MALLLEPETTVSANLDTIYPETEEDDPGPSGINPIQELNARVLHARVAGDYYRDLSRNYDEYHRTGDWPDHPFPNERHTWQTLDF